MTALPATSNDRIVWDTYLAAYRLPVLTVAVLLTRCSKLPPLTVLMLLVTVLEPV